MEFLETRVEVEHENEQHQYQARREKELDSQNMRLQFFVKCVRPLVYLLARVHQGLRRCQEERTQLRLSSATSDAKAFIDTAR